MLSKRTKYGIKALIYLAKNGIDRPIKVIEIATEENISRKFLEAIMVILKNNGLVNAKKGAQGGYYLTKNPTEINLSSIYRMLEGPIAMVPCVSLNYYEKCDDCKDELSCSIHRVMIQVRDNTLSILENTSLKEMIKD